MIQRLLFGTSLCRAALLGVALAAACKRPSPEPAPSTPIHSESEGSTGAMARPAPPEPSASSSQAPPPSRCRALVNLSPRHVAEVRIEEKITMASAPGLVLQDGEGLMGLQLISHGKKPRTWTSLVAWRLPSGPPSVWLEEEPSFGEDDRPEYKSFAYDSVDIHTIIGPFVSLYHDRHFGQGNTCIAGPPTGMMLKAPGGQRVTLEALIGSDALGGVVARFDPPLEQAKDAKLWGHLRWESGTPGKRELQVGAELSEGTHLQWISVREVPPALAPYLTRSPSVPTLIGHPRGCAAIGLAGNALLVQRNGEVRPAKLPLPLHLRGADLLGVVWLTIDDPFTLSQLPPSGKATDRAIAPVAPPVKLK